MTSDMNRDDIAWAIAKSAFADDMARVENNISEFAGRLLGAGVSHLNHAARNYAPELLMMIRLAKIERAIARDGRASRRQQGERRETAKQFAAN